MIWAYQFDFTASWPLYQALPMTASALSTFFKLSPCTSCDHGLNRSSLSYIMSQRISSVRAGPDLGHVHRKVTDLQRALDFYCGVLGFELQQLYGADAAFIAAGG
jgi:hypothetical protein